ncbi:DinB family protein [Terrabacter sp. BE26]|uniref:DinB family protein n=1 Tax=Terrabacter sp. BE26 TaxID=2898152 RepID=UPI0035BE185D
MSEPTHEPIDDPGPATPDDADWTWVLTRPCPDCGFDPATVEAAAVPALLRDAGRRYAARLGEDDARTRPGEGVWSPLEYACHVRDVCAVMTGRLEQILAGGGEVVTFANWDQDATAAERQYWRSDPDVVALEVTAAFETAATAYARPSGTEWEWPALRSNGSSFTAGTLALYFVHDVRHHLWDVTA